MASSPLKSLHLHSITAATGRLRFLSFRDHPNPTSLPAAEGEGEGQRIFGTGVGLGWWQCHNSSNKDGAGPLLRFPRLPRDHTCHPLPPLPLRLQVLPPPLRLHLLHQLRTHRPLTMASSVSPDSSHPSPPVKTVRAVINGRVQGVFYRNWTVENASQLGLYGWVRNRRDGSVEALFSGKPELVDEMEQRCRRGPPDAMVTSLQVFPCNDDPGTGFQRKPTV
ncbi:uncharacterized protein LOC116197268 [Punica granatum]|uniref:acylphosphatase n=2 Tax=Punica granatum TaxID=22663 RepID=A0A2I0JMU5_PUNGR|nr:uncharacterized protein LOC116197268 [Punica granatum]PKI57608.1 hypothetical protein CRG98_021936 [Punica granatum]